MDCGKKTIITALTLTIVLTLILGVRPALAVDDLGLFELEGNALDNLATPGDDWNTLDAGGGSAIAFTEILPDCAHSSCDPAFQDRIFVGGRKDTQDITDWAWVEGSGFPDKDEITNAYAAAYMQDSNLIVYFGADRFANKGDAYLGFWLFQNKVGINQDGSFFGHHEVGDILVLVNYPQSSKRSPKYYVIQWNPAEADVAKNLKMLTSGCVCDGSGFPACAITNNTDVTLPCPYKPKRGTQNVCPCESFFEGGINITELLCSTPCFSSFLAETRSSRRFTASLKDFVVGDLDVCGISVEKDCDVIRLAEPRDLTDKFFVVDFNGTVTNTGAGTLPAGSSITIVDYTADSDITLPTIILADPFLTGESVPFSGQFFTNLNPPTNKVKASLTFPDSVTTIDAEEFSIECGELIIDPNLELKKQCEVELETIDDQLVVVVYFSASVKNVGNVPLNVTVEDEEANIVFGPTTLNPNEMEIFGGSYYPIQADSGVTLPCKAEFSDTLTALGISPIPGLFEIYGVTSATCPLCPEECPD